MKNCTSQLALSIGKMLIKTIIQATNETKLRSFQIRLNLRPIVTQLQLHGFELVNDNLSKFCRKEPETLMHLVCDCEIVVSEFMSPRLLTNIVLRKQHMLFGFDHKGIIFCFLNGLLICARFLICRCKYSKSKPDMLLYFNLIDQVKKSEYIIVKQSNKLCVHFKRWKLF